MDMNATSTKVNINSANNEALNRIQQGRPVLVGLGIAREVVPGMNDNLILHAGPPITWERMSGPMKGAVIGGLIYEGRAASEEEATNLAASGDIKFDPWHHHNGVGPMAGICTASMPVWIVENKTFGNQAYCTLNEGLGKVLRYGAFSTEVIERLKWMENSLAPILADTLKLLPNQELDLRNIIIQALMMGDEVHNRNRAATSLLIRELAPAMMELSKHSEKERRRVLEFINSNDHFFLNLSMPAAKSNLQAAEWIDGSSIVTAMARNGTDFGIRVSGLKDMWFTAPANPIKGLLFPGFTAEDCNLDIGDSTISETAGIGAFTMAAAPAIVKFVGGSVRDAFEYSLSMYDICAGESEHYQIPNLDFRGSALGIDLLKVCELDVLPRINTGIAHRKAGIGQVGAGLVEPPRSCFTDALEAFVSKYC